ncbi:MAG TPA: universal stress protein [Paenalcaligenes sp.]|nr:universal stress protein [Paenalcaligenes sp.]
MKNILVLIDGSEPSLRAIEQAFEYAKLVDEATVHIVNVQIAITPRRAARLFSQEVLDEYYSEEGRLVMEKAKDLITDAPVKIKKSVVVGELEDSVQNYIQDHGCTHAIMGTRGLGAVPGLFLGSVTTKIIQAIDIPLTLVK